MWQVETRTKRGDHYLQLGNHLVTLLQESSSIRNELINNSLGGLLLVHNSSDLTHQEGTGIVQGVIINIIGQVLKVVLDGDDTLGSKLLNLLGAVLLPVQNVRVLTDAQGATSEDNSTNVILEAGSADSLLVGNGGTSLLGQNEAGTDPDGGGTEHEGSGDGVTVEQTTGGDDLHGLAGQRALAALDQLGHGGDEDGGGDVTGVTATLTTLGADDIDADVEGLLDVLGVADHVHAEDAGTVELLDNGLGGDTDGGDEELGTALDDDIDELVELALGVVVAVGADR